MLVADINVLNAGCGDAKGSPVALIVVRFFVADVNAL
jgi:hypothetical protein